MTELMSMMSKIIFYEYAGIVLLIVFCILLVLSVNIYYRRTSYYLVTKNPLRKVWYDLGCRGEYYIYKNLRHFERDGAKFLFNCYLPDEKYETTEIDVIMIHKNGIFVFESKNLSGWIYGNDTMPRWIQSLPRGRGRKPKKNFFSNPINQNERHIAALKKFLGEESSYVYRSIIVFSIRCDLKNLTLTKPNNHVIKRDYLPALINRIIKKNDFYLSERHIEKIYKALYPCSQSSEETKKRHVENLNNKHRSPNRASSVSAPNAQSPDAKKIEEIGVADNLGLSTQIQSDTSGKREILICPRCGSNLILKKAERGSRAGKLFYGCSSFPKCRFLINVEDLNSIYNTSNQQKEL